MSQQARRNRPNPIVVITAILVPVLLITLPHAVQQLRHTEATATHERSPADATSLAATSTAGVGVTAPAALPPTLPAPGLPLPTPSGSGRQWRVYRDPQYGFQLEVPAGWRASEVGDEDAPASSADHSAVFEAADTGARLAVSVWEASELASFYLWAGVVARGMQSVDGQLPTNALVAGHAALVVWAPESPATPAQYAALLARQSRYYRLAYSATDGGAALGDFVRALVPLSWDGEETQDIIPPLPAPTGRFYPSNLLFGPSR